jgi:hypothetical protein
MSKDKKLYDILVDNDRIKKDLNRSSESPTTKRPVRDEDKKNLEDLVSKYTVDYQKLEKEEEVRRLELNSLAQKLEGINNLLSIRHDSRKKLEENDKKYETFKKKVNIQLAQTDDEINAAVDFLLKQPQASPAHVSAAEGEIQLSAEMKDFADDVDAIIKGLLDNPYVNPNGEFSDFVNYLIKHDDGEILANLYLSLFIDLETQYTVSLSKSPERFNIENKGVTLSASLAASVAREFPDESPTIQSISNGVISFSIEPRRSEVMEEGTDAKEGESVLDFSPHKPRRTDYQPTRNTSVTFDVSILLELIESMICDLLSFNESEFPENPNRPPENDRSTSEILLHELQLIELLIRDHETKIKHSNLYNELNERLLHLRGLFDTNLKLSQDEQLRINQNEPQPVATGTTAGNEMDTHESSEEEIRVPSFIDYAMSSMFSLDTCIQELNLVISNTELIDYVEYIYIRPSSIHINEQQPSPSPAPPVRDFPKQPNMGYAGAAVLEDMTGFTLGHQDRVNEGLRQMDAALAANGGDSIVEIHDGGRPITKKPTRRKPRRNTRNYQSHNKRKHHSNKKSTIRHRKSYRKRNHTIKRRSHRK